MLSTDNLSNDGTQTLQVSSPARYLCTFCILVPVMYASRIMITCCVFHRKAPYRFGNYRAKLIVLSSELSRGYPICIIPLRKLVPEQRVYINDALPIVNSSSAYFKTHGNKIHNRLKHPLHRQPIINT